MSQTWDMGGNDLYCNQVSIGCTAPGQTGTVLSGAELTVLDSVTPGTVVASKAVVVDSSKNIGTFGTVGSAAHTITSASASALSVGLTGATNSAFKVDASTASQVAGLKVVGAATGGNVALVTTDSGAANNLTINALGTGTIGIGSVSTGAVTITPATTVTGLLTTSAGHSHAAGTTAIAPITLTAGTNLTTATAGAVEFDGTAFYATAVASSRQILRTEQRVLATANSATYSNTLLDTNVAAPVFTTTTSGTAAGAVTLVAGKTYGFEFMYSLTNTGTTSHTWATLFAGSATFSAGTLYNASGVSYTTASTPVSTGLEGFISSTTMTTPLVLTAASTSATEQVTVKGEGIFVINGAGTVIPSLVASARPGASGTPGVIVLAGSFFRIWETSTAAFVGNWS